MKLAVAVVMVRSVFRQASLIRCDKKKVDRYNKRREKGVPIKITTALPLPFLLSQGKISLIFNTY
jgi:hypothetical protein